MNRLLSILFCLLSFGATAQNMLRLQRYTVDEGLSQSTVYHIFQDAYGFMWFATGDGLNKFDGKQFTAYKSRYNDTSKGGLKDRNINSKIMEDHKGRLWFTSDAGLYYMDKRRSSFHVVIDKFTTDCACVLIDVDTSFVWVAVPRRGIFSVDINTLKISYYPFTDKLQASRDAIAIIRSGNGNKQGLYITDRFGILYFDKERHTDKRLIESNEVNSALLTHTGRLLVASRNGVYLYDTGMRTNSFTAIGDNTKANGEMRWWAIAEDTFANCIYMAARFGGIIYKLNLSDGRQEQYNFQNSDIRSLFVDRSHNLWVGTEAEGLYKLDIKPIKFHCYAPNKKMITGDERSFFVKGLYRNSDKKIWMGIYNMGLYVFDSATGKHEKVYTGLSDNELIGGILKDSSGRIAVAIGNSVLWFDAATRKILARITLPPRDELSSDPPFIYSLLEWKKGRYMAGTNLGIYPFVSDGETIKSFKPYDQTSSNFMNAWIYNMYQLPNGIIYMGRRNGFTKVKLLNDTTALFLDDGFYDLPIRHFYKSATSPILWLATEQGLIAYNETTKKHKLFDETSGLANSFLYSVLPQNDSSLWVSTNKGISCARIRYSPTLQVRFTNYSAKDGLQSNEFNSGSFCKSDDGYLVFGGIEGINWFNPDQIVTNKFLARPVLSAIAVNDSAFATDTAVYYERLELPYNKNTVTLSFSALEYTRPNQNQFAFMLEGLEHEWVYTTSDKVRYSNLSPGAYTFLLKASNNDGLWNEQPLRLTIIINPPYWKTWWFKLVAATIAITGILLTAQYYLKQKIRERTKELERQHALNVERLRISKDVHDDIGSGLSKISLISELAQKKATGNDKLQNDIKNIALITKELVENMHDLIWVLNPENSKLEILVARFREYCADYLDGMQLQAILHFPETIPDTSICREAQKNIFSTVKEALNNCVKHAKATQIIITLNISNDTLAIEIADNGLGFDQTKTKYNNNGLRNMKQRMEAIGGSFVISSQAASGSVVHLSASLTKISCK